MAHDTPVPLHVGVDVGWYDVVPEEVCVPVDVRVVDAVGVPLPARCSMYPRDSFGKKKMVNRL